MEKKQISKKYQYDPLNRLVSVTEKDDRTQVYTYDPTGNRTMTTILESGRVLLGIETRAGSARTPGPGGSSAVRELRQPGSSRDEVLQELRGCGHCSGSVLPGCGSFGMPGLWQSEPARCDILCEMRQKNHLISFYFDQCFFLEGAMKSRSVFTIFLPAEEDMGVVNAGNFQRKAIMLHFFYMQTLKGYHA